MTSKDFFDRITNDEVFAAEISGKIKAQIDSGEKDYKKILIPVAREAGYELTEEELDKRYEQFAADLSEEELGKIAGGTSVFPTASDLKLSID